MSRGWTRPPVAVAGIKQVSVWIDRGGAKCNEMQVNQGGARVLALPAGLEKIDRSHSLTCMEIHRDFELHVSTAPVIVVCGPLVDCPSFSSLLPVAAGRVPMAMKLGNPQDGPE